MIGVIIKYLDTKFVRITMISRSVFFLAIFSASFLSSKSVEDSAWLPQEWSWEDWSLSASNTSQWMSIPDVNEYFVKIEASFEKFVEQMKNDYTELTSEVEARVTRDMERLRELKERLKEAVMERREAVR